MVELEVARRAMHDEQSTTQAALREGLKIDLEHVGHQCSMRKTS